MYGYGYPYGFYVDPTYVLLIIGMCWHWLHLER